MPRISPIADQSTYEAANIGTGITLSSYGKAYCSTFLLS
jgi:hypothetical protein